MATPPPPPGPPPGSAAGASQAWRRLRLAFRVRASRSQIAGALLLGLLGFAATVQVQALRTTDQYAVASRPQLIQILDGLSQRSERLEGEVNDLERARTQLLSGADKKRTALEQAKNRATTLGILAGTVPARGPGIRMTIHDSQEAVRASLVLNTVEELRDAGAESIEINNQVRLVASSYVLDGQGGIVVDGTLIPPPYTIEAIGDPKTLATAMRIPGGVVDEVRGKRGQIAVHELDTVRINTLHRTSPPRYAQPAPGDSDSGDSGDSGSGDSGD